MGNLLRVRCPWTGAVVGGGVSTFYIDAGFTDVSDIKDFFTACSPFLPSSAVISVPNNADTIDEFTGALTGNVALTGSGTVTGGGNSAYSAGVGAFINWNTGAVVNGRMLKGRTFIAPLGQGFASTDGTLNDSTRASLDVAALALVSSALISIWHRPTEEEPTSGIAHLVTSAQTVDRVTSLKTRRY